MFSFEPVDAPLGAIVRGVDLSAAVDSRSVEALIKAVLSHGVLVIRGGELTTLALMRFASCLGELAVPEPVVVTNVLPGGNLVAADSPDAAALQRYQRWQTDGSFQPVPPRFTATYAAEVPTRGGQTQFADMRRAITLLPPDDRAEMGELQLVHAHGEASAQHRWIQVDPNGQPTLFMGAHASHIVGRDRTESQRWFDEIENQLAVHDVFYEHQWKAHDLVLADNRVTLHRTLGYDMANEPRTMHIVHIS